MAALSVYGLVISNFTSTLTYRPFRAPPMRIFWLLP